MRSTLRTIWLLGVDPISPTWRPSSDIPNARSSLDVCRAESNIQYLEPVISAYPDRFYPKRWEALGTAGGFSGARFWRLQTEAGTMCLRRWSREHPTPERLDYIHSVLRFVCNAGLTFIPRPVPSQQGHSCIRHGGYLWELTPWMPGRADYAEAPGTARLAAALQALAQFHRAAARVPFSCLRPAVAPSVQERRRLLEGLFCGGLSQIHAAMAVAPRSPVAYIGAEILDLFPQVAKQVAAQVTAAGSVVVPIQPCIRDIWHDHVLFRGDRVSGVIDFGAMRDDSIAVDISRLLGSLAGDDAASWQRGLEAYQQIRRLTREEWALISVLDNSATLLAGINWLQWLYVQQRVFDEFTQIEPRLRAILGRIKALVSRSGRFVLDVDVTKAPTTPIMP